MKVGVELRIDVRWCVERSVMVREVLDVLERIVWR